MGLQSDAPIDVQTPKRSLRGYCCSFSNPNNTELERLHASSCRQRYCLCNEEGQQTRRRSMSDDCGRWFFWTQRVSVQREQGEQSWRAMLTLRHVLVHRGRHVVWPSDRPRLQRPRFLNLRTYAAFPSISHFSYQIPVKYLICQISDLIYMVVKFFQTHFEIDQTFIKFIKPLFLTYITYFTPEIPLRILISLSRVGSSSRKRKKNVLCSDI